VIDKAHMYEGVFGASSFLPLLITVIAEFAI
jgi:hypothetical protein